jgi:hypothetical protein
MVIKYLRMGLGLVVMFSQGMTFWVLKLSKFILFKYFEVFSVMQMILVLLDSNYLRNYEWLLCTLALIVIHISR